jgi:hypothetical protein
MQKSQDHGVFETCDENFYFNKIIESIKNLQLLEKLDQKKLLGIDYLELLTADGKINFKTIQDQIMIDFKDFIESSQEYVISFLTDKKDFKVCSNLEILASAIAISNVNDRVNALKFISDQLEFSIQYDNFSDLENLEKVKKFSQMIIGRFGNQENNSYEFDCCLFEDKGNFFEFNSDQYQIKFNKNNDIDVKFFDKTSNNSIKLIDSQNINLAIFTSLSQLKFDPEFVIDFLQSSPSYSSIEPKSLSHLLVSSSYQFR